MTAPDAIVMLAVNEDEPLNVVEFTVTPPGLVVPVTNHWALAPFLNPLPLTVTFRFTVPWGAALGGVDLPGFGEIPKRAQKKLIAAPTRGRTTSQCLDSIRAPKTTNS